MKTGDIVKVKVIDVDVARKRIALTMRLRRAVGKCEKITALYHQKLVIRQFEKQYSPAQTV